MQQTSADAHSALYWVQEMQRKEFNPVLFLKPQGEKSDCNDVEKKRLPTGIANAVPKRNV